MAKRSAGILVFRRGATGIEVFLVHPGGPFWMRKDDGAWSIPKGVHDPDEDALEAARREFSEETGAEIEGAFMALGEFKQPGGKIVSAWAVEGDLDPKDLKSNLFELEWPPRSGRLQQFPEVDRAEWFDLAVAMRKVSKGQVPLLRAFADHLRIAVR